MKDKTTSDTIALDKQYLWHPFTQMADWLDGEPVMIERGEGFFLVDTEGRRYIDGVSSLWCNVHGHRVPAIDAAIRDQLDRIAHSTLLGLGQTRAAELAERLIRIAGAAKGLLFRQRGNGGRNCPQDRLSILAKHRRQRPHAVYRRARRLSRRHGRGGQRRRDGPVSRHLQVALV